jgi:HTH-type transcriptional regulator / antitoxin HipB
MVEPDLLAEIVRKHRKMAGLSQLQLADMAGVGKTVVYDIEKGKATIRLDTLRKILSVLNIRVQLSSPLINKISGNEKS